VVPDAIEFIPFGDEDPVYRGHDSKDPNDRNDLDDTNEIEGVRLGDTPFGGIADARVGREFSDQCQRVNRVIPVLALRHFTGAVALGYLLHRFQHLCLCPRRQTSQLLIYCLDRRHVDYYIASRIARKNRLL